MIFITEDRRRDEMEAIKLGVLARDRISGFEGIVVARTEWVYGCTRVGLQSRELDDDGDVRDDKWFDERQVEVIGSGVSEDRWAWDPSEGESAGISVPEESGAPRRMAGTGGPERATGAVEKETG